MMNRIGIAAIRAKRGIRFYRSDRPVFGFNGIGDSLDSYTYKYYKDNGLPDVAAARAQSANIFRLITAYQDIGHLVSSVNPLEKTRLKPESLQQLQPEYYSLQDSDSVNPHLLVNYESGSKETVANIVEFLKRAYCGHLCSDLSYLPMKKRDWLSMELEHAVNRTWDDNKKTKVARLLLESELFDNFLAKKFPTLKRYGLEGAESQLAFFLELFRSGRTTGLWSDVVIGMTHRGRLNFLTTLLNTPPSLIFHKISGGAEMSVEGKDWYTADVLSHIQCCTVTDTGIAVSLLPNPSHLELTNPASMGNTRAKQLLAASGPYSAARECQQKIVNIQVHGDAALAGQGVNQETLAMSRVPHYSVSGSIHLVVNNQLGFTTPAHRGRSSTYPSDLAKIVEAPILLVNGDDIYSVMKAAEIAVRYVAKFEEDIFVEIQCYRRHGHNELDDPTVTNPDLYSTISETRTLPRKFIDHLIEEEVISTPNVENWENEYTAYLNDEYKKNITPPVMYLTGKWAGMQVPGDHITSWDTGVDTGTLRYLGIMSVKYPDEFVIHEHVRKTHIKSRLQAMQESDPLLDWSTAEALAIGSLLSQKFYVRISGQDVGRGTFAHRHAMLVDQKNCHVHIPLNECNLQYSQGNLEVANSILSEEAVLAYEYGLSIESPNILVIWEAQFGDFMNGGQNVIDTLISSSQAKWARSTSLTLLLPHGYDGAGPEHSSARVERFLQLSNSSEVNCDGDNVNLQVAWPTTPAQYFHLLRRQQIRNFRLPLVVIAPKTLLRLPSAKSRISEFAPGTSWLDVIAEDNPNATRVVFCSGKHFYTLSQNKTSHVALVRVESLVPFPTAAIQKCLASYPYAKEFIWSQEEPSNMGAWSFVRPRFQNLVGISVKYAGRPQLATPAYGLPSLHKETLDNIISDTFS